MYVQQFRGMHVLQYNKNNSETCTYSNITKIKREMKWGRQSKVWKWDRIDEEIPK